MQTMTMGEGVTGLGLVDFITQVIIQVLRTRRRNVQGRGDNIMTDDWREDTSVDRGDVRLHSRRVRVCFEDDGL